MAFKRKFKSHYLESYSLKKLIESLKEIFPGRLQIKCYFFEKYIEGRHWHFFPLIFMAIEK